MCAHSFQKLFRQHTRCSLSSRPGPTALYFKAILLGFCTLGESPKSCVHAESFVELGKLISASLATLIILWNLAPFEQGH